MNQSVIPIKYKQTEARNGLADWSNYFALVNIIFGRSTLYKITLHVLGYLSNNFIENHIEKQN